MNNAAAEANKLYVAGIAYATTSESLKAAFEQAGEVVEAIIITDRDSGRSKGFGFVTMATPEAAKAAIDMWNEKELDGRMIRVTPARPREERSDRGPRRF